MSIWHIKGDKDAVDRLLKDNILQLPQPWMPFFNFELSVDIGPEFNDLVKIDSGGKIRWFKLLQVKPVYEETSGKKAVKNYDCDYIELKGSD